MMLPDTETETRLLKANNYNCSYALMDACKEIDQLTATITNKDIVLPAYRAEVEQLRQALNEFLSAYARATRPNFHHHLCPCWLSLNDDFIGCDCGAKEAIEGARAALNPPRGAKP